MKNKRLDAKYEMVGKAIRMEIDTGDNSLYLVFKVTNESFAKKVREEWLDEIPVQIKGKDLVLFKGDK